MTENEKMSNEKFSEWLENCSELDLFLTIDLLGYFIWYLSHQLTKGSIGKDAEERNVIRRDIKAMQKRQSEAAPYCSKYGINFEIVEKEDDKGKFSRLYPSQSFEDCYGTVQKPSDEYWQWYKHWDSWKKSLSKAEWDEFKRLRDEDKPVDHLLPETDWQGNDKKSSKCS